MKYGIDYGMGRTNRDMATGIRFGVIPLHMLHEFAYDSFEADYGPATCGKCGNPAVEYDDDKHSDAQRYDDDDNPIGEVYTHEPGCADYACEHCHRVFDSSDAFGDYPVSQTLDEDGIEAALGSDGDVVVFKSPYYTHAEYCSPCAPGACYLKNATDEGGPRAYCFGHDWFEGDRAPYPVYEMATGRIIPPPQ